MAGCRPEYLPVVLAGVRGGLHARVQRARVLATTFFATPVLLVNGPIRTRIGMNSGITVSVRATAPTRRSAGAVQLVVRNVGDGRPGEGVIDRAALGQPGKLSMCFAENEERSNWEPFHVERGFAAETSTITAFAGGAPTGFMDQLARDARTLATSYGLALAAVGHPKHYFSGGDHRRGATGARGHLREGRLDQESGARPDSKSERTASVRARARCRVRRGSTRAVVERLGGRQQRVPKFQSADKISLVVAGGEAGKFGAYFQGWVSGPVGSIMTTREIGD